jgi:peptidoglycan biosynthesis protein MviN/MurJ (putative lipid II flippase)
MLDRILTVSGFTLLSRVTGLMRDIMLAAILGAGPVRLHFGDSYLHAPDQYG